jgi:hypothetical protein
VLARARGPARHLSGDVHEVAMPVDTVRHEGGMIQTRPHPRASYQPTGLPLFCSSSHLWRGAK